METDAEKPNRKSRRRSSFTSGRAKLQQIPNNDLYKDIDVSIPAEMRLAELTKKCAKYSLDILTKEMPSLEDSEIPKDVETSVITTINSMMNNNAFFDLCHKKRYAENPVNMEINAAVAKYESLIKKFEAESSCWEEMKTKVKKMLEEAELQDIKKVKNFDDLPEDVLTCTENYLPSTDFNLEKIRQAGQHALLLATISVDSLQTTCNMLTRESKDLHSRLQDLQSCYAASETNELPSPMKGTPRRLLQKMSVE